MTKRQSNRPGRRMMAAGAVAEPDIAMLVDRLRYVGSGLHKLHPADYDFVPSHNPRPSKSPCDDIRSVTLVEASDLFRRGIELGMVSVFPEGGVPKYVWAVDHNDQVYEAKTKPQRETDYHGYRLGEDDHDMREHVLREWRRRCPRR